MGRGVCATVVMHSLTHNVTLFVSRLLRAAHNIIMSADLLISLYRSELDTRLAELGRARDEDLEAAVLVAKVLVVHARSRRDASALKFAEDAITMVCAVRRERVRARARTQAVAEQLRAVSFVSLETL